MGSGGGRGVTVLDKGCIPVLGGVLWGVVECVYCG